MMMDKELEERVKYCVQKSREFTQLYFSILDNQRQELSTLYSDNALLVWNGNGTTGKDDIQKYVMQLPPSQHSLCSLDAHPIINEIAAAAGEFTYLLQIGGTVIFQGRPEEPFQQTLFITASHGDSWKIVSDCYRLQGALSSDRDTACASWMRN